MLLNLVFILKVQNYDFTDTQYAGFNRLISVKFYLFKYNKLNNLLLVMWIIAIKQVHTSDFGLLVKALPILLGPRSLLLPFLQ